MALAGALTTGRHDHFWPRCAEMASSRPGMAAAPAMNASEVGIMLRARLNDELKLAMKAKDSLATSTLRLILAALKDRDIAARDRGITDGIGDDEIVEMMQKMVRQRQESGEIYAKNDRPELAEKEAQEIVVIERFLPKQLSQAEMQDAIDQAIAEIGASSIKDMGKVMGALKANHAGRMDFAKAGALVKAKLA